VRLVICRELWGFFWRNQLEENHCDACLKQKRSEAQEMEHSREGSAFEVPAPSLEKFALVKVY
jgi:hypothetical protein